MRDGDENKKIDSTARHYPVLDILLFVFWILLTGIVIVVLQGRPDRMTLYSFLSGITAVFVVSYLSHRFILRGEERKHTYTGGLFSKIRSWSFLISHLFIHLFLSTISFVRQTLFYDIEPKIVSIPVRLDSESELTLLSSMITMTPGTLVMKTERTEKGYILKTHFSYLRDDEVVDEIDGTIKRWEKAIRGLFR